MQAELDEKARLRAERDERWRAIACEHDNEPEYCNECRAAPYKADIAQRFGKLRIKDRK